MFIMRSEEGCRGSIICSRVVLQGRICSVRRAWEEGSPPSNRQRSTLRVRLVATTFLEAQVVEGVDADEAALSSTFSFFRRDEFSLGGEIDAIGAGVAGRRAAHGHCGSP